jgi:uncharacterized protein YicC (UPF0701 family)
VEQPEVKQKCGEAEAILRVASAAREVLSASEALEEHAEAEGSEGVRALYLARLATAVDDLQSARDALGELLAKKLR